MTDTTPATLTFEDAAPVKRPFSGGKTAEPNPFTGVIQSIALQTKDGAPVAKSATFIHTMPDGEHVPGEVIKKDRARWTRQLTDAGEKNVIVGENGSEKPNPVTVRVRHEDAHTTEQVKPGQPKTTVYRTRVTFWTVPKISRKKKDTTPAADTK